MATREQYDEARRHLQTALAAIVRANKLFVDDAKADPDVRTDIFDAEDSVRRARQSIINR